MESYSNLGYISMKGGNIPVSKEIYLAATDTRGTTELNYQLEYFSVEIERPRDRRFPGHISRLPSPQEESKNCFGSLVKLAFTFRRNKFIGTEWYRPIPMNYGFVDIFFP
ncbi:hypothetical protein WA026_010486 [Henosepilachna vigintioctopunctata]|uniref:Uncharacterized protein n=1 Tax=Henosepilachna vigintioctopunctata TaxID=420089 RepID=A0AAW1V5S1_9CUCU